MSLRWRVSLALAVLTTLVAAALAVWSYTATSRELIGQVDGDLAQVVLQLQAPPHHPPAGRVAGSTSSLQPAPPAANSPPPRGSVFLPASPLPTHALSGAPAVAAVQHLSPAGVVNNTNHVLSIPVSPTDRLVAAHKRGSITEDETIRGVSYRVLIAPLKAAGALQVAISLTSVNAALAGVKLRFVLGAVAAALIAALAGWLIARRMALPLERLAQAADRIALTGDLEFDAESTRRDETGRLTRAIGTMLASLRRSREDQHQLVQDAGHELRTPLTSVRTNLDILQRHDGKLSTADRARLVGSIRREVEGLAALTGELVELATDSRDAEPVAPVNVREVVDTTVGQFTERTGRPVVVGGEPWVVEGRPHALSRAIANLLDNAAKFSAPGEAIGVDVDVRAGVVRVRDHGGGFNLTDIDRVFDRFYRSPTVDDLPGSGLGLSIVRKIVAMHGGVVFAENAADGGAVVGFTLPRPGTAHL